MEDKKELYTTIKCKECGFFAYYSVVRCPLCLSNHIIFTDHRIRRREKRLL